MNNEQLVTDKWLDELKTYLKNVGGCLLQRAEIGGLTHLRVSLDIRRGIQSGNNKPIGISIEASKFSTRKWLGDGNNTDKNGFTYAEKTDV